MPRCHKCGRPLCPACKRCLKEGHREDCPSEDAARCRAWIASLDKPKARAVGLLEIIMREDEDAQES